MDEENQMEDPWPPSATSAPRTMEAHYRSLVLAIVVVTAAVVAWVGWGIRRDTPSPSDLVMASPRSATVPLAGRFAETAKSPIRPPEAPSAAPAGSPVASKSTAAADSALPRVHVVGAVRRSGVYVLPPRARVVDALQKAGGARPDADLEAINLADFVRDGEQIRVPSRRETARTAARPPITPPAAILSAPPSPARVSPRRPTRAPSPTRGLGRYPSAPSTAPPAYAGGGGLVNVNTAGPEELDTLPGVGPATAQAILDYRREHGPFQRPEDLLQVRGIGEKKLAAMLDRVTVR